MIELMNQYKKGKEIQIKASRAIITSDLMKFKEFYAIYADIIEDIDFKQPCKVCRINDNIALIIRNREKLSEMRINYRRKKSHILS